MVVLYIKKVIRRTKILSDDDLIELQDKTSSVYKSWGDSADRNKSHKVIESKKLICIAYYMNGDYAFCSPMDYKEWIKLVSSGKKQDVFKAKKIR